MFTCNAAMLFCDATNCTHWYAELKRCIWLSFAIAPYWGWQCAIHGLHFSLQCPNRWRQKLKQKEKLQQAWVQNRQASLLQCMAQQRLHQYRLDPRLFRACNELYVFLHVKSNCQHYLTYTWHQCWRPFGMSLFQQLRCDCGIVINFTWNSEFEHMNYV